LGNLRYLRSGGGSVEMRLGLPEPEVFDCFETANLIRLFVEPRMDWKE
jgi:hypothetical protein